MLTYNIQVHEVTSDGLRAYLTFVDTGIPFLGPLDLQNPLIRQGVIVGLKTLVTGIGVSADC